MNYCVLICIHSFSVYSEQLKNAIKSQARATPDGAENAAERYVERSRIFDYINIKSDISQKRFRRFFFYFGS